MHRFFRLLAFGALPFIVVGTLRSTHAAEVVVDCSKPLPAVRPLHGVNNGPLGPGGLLDLSAHYRELSIPLTRLHDSHWPNPDVVDMHAVFPDADADPALPESYDFVRTDEYVQSIVDTGSRVVYRLGQSIEHGKDKRRVRPPADPAKWAAACVGIIRHYNDGWADGFRHDVRYWEIWNEPDNRPNCWTGSDEDYFRLYATTAREIKRQFPDLKVGGPAVGNSGKMNGDALEPTAFVSNFLDFCNREDVPLDFFSWHHYCADPRELPARARAVRALLDRRGFTKTESHLNEWNYLPDDDWTPVVLAGQGGPRRRFYQRQGGAEGAAFAAAALMLLQDSPLDAANYFRGDAGDFGLFDPHGVPNKAFYAFKAFRALLDTPRRVEAGVRSGEAGAHMAACAGLNQGHSELTVLVSAFRASNDDGKLELTVSNLPWDDGSEYEILSVDAGNDLARVKAGGLNPGESRIGLPVRSPVVYVVTVRPRADD